MKNLVHEIAHSMTFLIAWYNYTLLISWPENINIFFHKDMV